MDQLSAAETRFRIRGMEQKHQALKRQQMETLVDMIMDGAGLETFAAFQAYCARHSINPSNLVSLQREAERLLTQLKLKQQEDRQKLTRIQVVIDIHNRYATRQLLERGQMDRNIATWLKEAHEKDSSIAPLKPHDLDALASQSKCFVFNPLGYCLHHPLVTSHSRAKRAAVREHMTHCCDVKLRPYTPTASDRRPEKKQRLEGNQPPLDRTAATSQEQQPYEEKQEQEKKSGKKRRRVSEVPQIHPLYVGLRSSKITPGRLLRAWMTTRYSLSMIGNDLEAILISVRAFEEKKTQERDWVVPSAEAMPSHQTGPSMHHLSPRCRHTLTDAASLDCLMRRAMEEHVEFCLAPVRTGYVPRPLVCPSSSSSSKEDLETSSSSKSTSSSGFKIDLYETMSNVLQEVFVPDEAHQIMRFVSAFPLNYFGRQRTSTTSSSSSSSSSVPKSASTRAMVVEV